MTQDVHKIQKRTQRKANHYQNIRSFQLTENGLETIYFRLNYRYWKDNGDLTLISQEQFLKALNKRIQINNDSQGDATGLHLSNIELDYLNDFTRTQFRIYRFLRSFGRTEKNIAKIITTMKTEPENRLQKSHDGSCGISYLSFVRNMITNSIEVRLPRKTELYSYPKDYWTPREKKALKILEEHNRVGYNLINLKKALTVFSYCAIGYVSITTHLLLKKTNLIIILGSRLMLND
jgi:hypothetical protein